MNSWTTIKVKEKDVKRMDKMKLHKTEPYWSVVERALDKLKK